MVLVSIKNFTFLALALAHQAPPAQPPAKRQLIDVSPGNITEWSAR